MRDKPSQEKFFVLSPPSLCCSLRQMDDGVKRRKIGDDAISPPIFQKLPTEIAYEVLKWIPVAAMRMAAAVSKSWNEHVFAARDSISLPVRYIDEAIVKLPNLRFLELKTPRVIIRPALLECLTVQSIQYIQTLRLDFAMSEPTQITIATLINQLPNLTDLSCEASVLQFLNPMPNLVSYTVNVRGSMSIPHTNLHLCPALRHIASDCLAMSFQSFYLPLMTLEEAATLSELRYLDLRLVSSSEDLGGLKLAAFVAETMPRIELLGIQIEKLESSATELLSFIEAQPTSRVRKVLLRSTYFDNSRPRCLTLPSICACNLSSSGRRLVSLPDFEDSMLLIAANKGSAPLIHCIERMCQVPEDIVVFKDWVERVYRVSSNLPKELCSLTAKLTNPELLLWLLDLGFPMSVADTATRYPLVYQYLLSASTDRQTETLELVKELVRRGANYTPSKCANSVAAAAFRHPEVFQWLCSLPDIDINHVTLGNGNIFHAVALLEPPIDWPEANCIPKESTAIAMSLGGDINAWDDQGMTPLGLTCQNHQISSFRDLIECGSDVLAPMGNGQTPLTIVIESSLPQFFDSAGSMCADLVARGANLFEFDPRTRWSPFEDASTAFYVMANAIFGALEVMGGDVFLAQANRALEYISTYGKTTHLNWFINEIADPSFRPDVCDAPFKPSTDLGYMSPTQQPWSILCQVYILAFKFQVDHGLPADEFCLPYLTDISASEVLFAINALARTNAEYHAHHVRWLTSALFRRANIHAEQKPGYSCLMNFLEGVTKSPTATKPYVLGVVKTLVHSGVLSNVTDEAADALNEAIDEISSHGLRLQISTIMNSYG